MSKTSGPSKKKPVRDERWKVAVLSSALAAESTDFTPLIARYTKEYGVTDDEAKEHIKEMCRFLALSANVTQGRYSIMGAVDHVWHMFLIFTKLYAEFCDAVAGKFIHHLPAQMLSQTKGLYNKGYKLLLSDYKLAFNEDPPAHIWPRVKLGTMAEVECISCECETCSPVSPPCDAN
ncbi:hypothetical protein SAMN04490202_4422 [Pseudomonas reinekei]|uniref:Uncharacterized protein n=1 Tax=Pseudomonas reinekei TaxID=395598 RepID=A0A1H0T146_PSERE|nr:hypothetical protein [Pseudomonas reinekei]KAB0482024.1 hypothetical protein F7R15_24175 [Pseudomonas reinekei]OLT99952.1 hypothetical protein BVK86_23900 [Pseudomonas reinekei]SDP47664.1 hypothetical protein SAMN04490202_4422 [Pseudomonas reinekei]